MKYKKMLYWIILIMGWGFIGNHLYGASQMVGGTGYFSVGHLQLDLASLNNALSEQGLDTFEENNMLIGGGGYGVMKDVLIGGEGYGFLTLPWKENHRRYSQEGGYGLFQLGYRLWSNDKIHVFPIVGLGGGGMELNIGPESPDFDLMLQGNQSIFHAQYSTWLGMVGIRANYKLGLVRLGVRLSYLYSFADSWMLAGEEIDHFPDVDMSGLQMSVSVNLGQFGWLKE